MKRVPLVVCVALLFAACGSATTVIADSASDSTSGELCDPGPSPTAGVDDTVPFDRNGEALVKYLTGIDELAVTEETEGDELVYDDQNYGGVYGDFQGGWVVAVVDCSKVDPDRIAQLAGGPEAVRLIQVSHSFEEVNGFADELRLELRAAGLPADILTDSTLTGRLIRVVVEDIEQVPAGFGAGVPAHLFSIEEGPLFRTLGR